MSTALAGIEPKNRPSYTPAEMRARSILSRMDSLSAKLKTLEDDIRLLWVDFDNLKAGETILGCATKKEFCEKKLHRTPRAIQYMLAGGNPDNAKQSEIISLPSAVASKYALTKRQLKVRRQEFRTTHPESVNLSNDEVDALMYPPDQAPKEIALEDILAKFIAKTGASYQQVGEIAKQKSQDLYESSIKPDVQVAAEPQPAPEPEKSSSQTAELRERFTARYNAFKLSPSENNAYTLTLFNLAPVLVDAIGELLASWGQK